MVRFAVCFVLTMACLAGADDIPRVDLHAHIDGETPRDKRMTPAEATAISRKLGVQLGILGEGGCSGEIHDDRKLAAFLDSLADQPVWRGLQVYGFEWQRCLSRANLDRLDYLAADALVFPQDGKNIWLWLPRVKFADPQKFMDQYVEQNVRSLPSPSRCGPTRPIFRRACSPITMRSGQWSEWTA